MFIFRQRGCFPLVNYIDDFLAFIGFMTEFNGFDNSWLFVSINNVVNPAAECVYRMDCLAFLERKG